MSLRHVSSDLYGLMLFLGVDPYWVKFWWNKLLFEPYISGVKKPMYDAVSQALWRTAKDDVIDQVVTALCALFASVDHVNKFETNLFLHIGMLCLF